MSKPKVAFYWCASCGGCEEAVVDLAEGILGVVEAVDIVLWPVAMDFKKHDVETMPDKSIVATFLNGAIRSSEQEEMAHMLRRKSQYMIAYGACAATGGIPGLANQFTLKELLKFVYEDGPNDGPSNVNEAKTYPQTEHVDAGRRVTLPQIFDLVYRTLPSLEGTGALPAERVTAPEGTLSLPAFRDTVRTLDQVVDVDYYLPGCPPTPKLTQAAVAALLAGDLPPKGSVLAPDIALCDECPRKASKPTDLGFTQFQRPHQKLMDPEKCFLAQGVVCMGPATRGGCEALCINGHMPCSGCFGGTSRVKDQGAKILSSLAANLVPREVKEIDQVLAGIPDPVGTFYRYGLPASLLRKKVPGDA
jgi:F420-non-reducing hydrogenase small subunit